MGADRPTLRALLWCSAIALQLLPRTKAIVRPVPGTHRYAAYAKMLSRSIFARKLCLVAKHHSNAELIKITLTEH